MKHSWIDEKLGEDSGQRTAASAEQFLHPWYSTHAARGHYLYNYLYCALQKLSTVLITVANTMAAEKPHLDHIPYI